MNTRKLFVAAIVMAMAVPVLAEDWAHWRGPNFNGSSSATNLPLDFSKTQHVKWSVAMPGPSAATPIIVGDKVFVSTTDPGPQKLLAMCLDRKTGNTLWQHQVGSGFERDNRSTLASPSPVADADVVVFFYGNGDLAAFSHDGTKQWSRSLEEDYGRFAFLWTFSTSPTLVDGKLILQVLQRDMPVDRSKPLATTEGGKPIASYLLAVDPKTGKEIWKVERPSQAKVESREAFSTPIPYEGQLIVVGGDDLSGHDVATGKELWRWGTWNEQRISHWRLVPSPVIGGGVVLVCAPKKEPVFAVKLGGSGQLDASAVAWKSGDRSPVTSDVPTPLFYQDKFFVLSDVRKALTRVDPATGKEEWSIEMPGRYKWRTSPTGADGKIWCMNHHGDVVAVNAADGKILAQAAMGEEDDDNIRSGLPAVGSELFIRTNARLFCVGQ